MKPDDSHIRAVCAAFDSTSRGSLEYDGEDEPITLWFRLSDGEAKVLRTLRRCAQAQGLLVQLSKRSVYDDAATEEYGWPPACTYEVKFVRAELGGLAENGQVFQPPTPPTGFIHSQAWLGPDGQIYDIGHHSHIGWAEDGGITVGHSDFVKGVMFKLRWVRLTLDYNANPRTLFAETDRRLTAGQLAALENIGINIECYVVQTHPDGWPRDKVIYQPPDCEDWVGTSDLDEATHMSELRRRLKVLYDANLELHTPDGDGPRLARKQHYVTFNKVLVDDTTGKFVLNVLAPFQPHVLAALKAAARKLGFTLALHKTGEHGDVMTWKVVATLPALPTLGGLRETPIPQAQVLHDIAAKYNGSLGTPGWAIASGGELVIAFEHSPPFWLLTQNKQNCVRDVAEVARPHKLERGRWRGATRDEVAYLKSRSWVDANDSRRWMACTFTFPPTLGGLAEAAQACQSLLGS